MGTGRHLERTVRMTYWVSANTSGNETKLHTSRSCHTLQMAKSYRVATSREIEECQECCFCGEAVTHSSLIEAEPDDI